LTVELSIAIDLIFDSAKAVPDEKPEPIPDPDIHVAELLDVTNEFKISKPTIVEYDPLSNEPLPIPEPMNGLELAHGDAVERALALTHDSTI
jgi:hypothetical protein